MGARFVKNLTNQHFLAEKLDRKNSTFFLKKVLTFPSLSFIINLENEREVNNMDYTVQINEFETLEELATLESLEGYVDFFAEEED